MSEKSESVIAPSEQQAPAGALGLGTGSSLFIPLRREYFDAFKRGEKTEEYRKYGPRWNERTCQPGRAVTLSMGYGKKHRLTGRVKYFQTDLHPDRRPGFVACYGAGAICIAAVIGIELDDSNNPNQRTPEGGRETL